MTVKNLVQCNFVNFFLRVLCDELSPFILEHCWKLRVVRPSEGLNVQTVALGQKSDLVEGHSPVHLQRLRALEDFLVEPTPDALPIVLRVDPQRVEHHQQACWPAVS